MGIIDKFIKTEERMLENLNAFVSADDAALTAAQARNLSPWTAGPRGK